jgi:MSHA biogenesis protein MshG
MQLSKVSSKDLQVFTQQLSTLLTAKLALLKAIDVLSKEQKNNYFKSILKKISKKLADGQSFHKTLKLYPRVFSVFYCNMILIGEGYIIKLEFIGYLYI